MGAKNQGTVSRGRWGATFETSSEFQGVRLLVYIIERCTGGVCLIRNGDGYGKNFKTMEDAEAYALEHGYIQPYFRKLTQ